MYWTYLRRELAGRRRQTIIVAVGLAIAIALVIVVSSLAAGVRDAQAQALESVYGVGTDLTVTGAQAEPGQLGERGGPRFEFDQDGGATGTDGTTTLAQSRLMADPRRATLDAGTVQTVAGLDGVASASGALSLTDTTFSGELPQPPSGDAGSGDVPQTRPQGGGFGGGSFDVDTFTVLGVDPGADAVGPLSALALDDGRGLEAGDVGADVAVLDAAYATSAGLSVGDTVEVGGVGMEVVGIVSSTSSSADTAANVYLPLDVAQELAGVGDVVSTVYVQAASSDDIAAVQDAIAAVVPDATVSSQSELASTVSGSLSNASSLITSLGTWLSVVVLAVAVLLAVLFTMSGVARRTREFGTLKAIGWSDRRVVGQVAGESIVQGLLGGALGLALGLGAIGIIGLVSPTISASAGTQGGQAPGEVGGAGGPAFGGGGGPFGQAAQAAQDIVLHAPLTIGVVLVAVGLSIASGLIAGAFGGWRAARLSPAEALRSVA
ncbi:ABC transporter permease [Microbacterium sp.]|uniref:ABC transporter permease n=1 Tax=Microbacterium sp. TaxID=51671 RepID=UPI0032219937